MPQQPTSPTQIVYPETDGRPMAETDTHYQQIVALRHALQNHFKDDPNVYVSGNLLIYYIEGNPYVSLAPDIFVVKGVRKGLRRVYKLWEEGRAPQVVVEITSTSTKWEDWHTKLKVYRDVMKVREYFLYDPLKEYLDVRLVGYRLVAGDYQKIELTRAGHLYSEELGLELLVDETGLRLYDPVHGRVLLSPDEDVAAREAAERRAQQAEQRAQTEAAARQEAEAELERLRKEIARLRGET